VNPNFLIRDQLFE